MLSSNLAVAINAYDQSNGDNQGDKLKAEVNKSRNYVAKLLPKENHQPLGSALPHRNVDYKAGAPVLGVSIAPAYMTPVSTLQPSSLPRTRAPPRPRPQHRYQPDGSH